MHVHVDEPRKDRHVAEIVRVWARALIDLDDLRSTHFDCGVRERLAAAVDEPRGVNEHGTLLARVQARRRRRGRECHKRNQAGATEATDV
jgi:hypothetical protein